MVRNTEEIRVSRACSRGIQVPSPDSLWVYLWAHPWDPQLVTKPAANRVWTRDTRVANLDNLWAHPWDPRADTQPAASPVWTQAASPDNPWARLWDPQADTQPAANQACSRGTPELSTDSRWEPGTNLAVSRDTRVPSMDNHQDSRPGSRSAPHPEGGNHQAPRA